MEDIKEKKQALREQMTSSLDALSKETFEKKNRVVAEKLFNFANFLEAKIALLYLHNDWEINSDSQFTGFLCSKLYNFCIFGSKVRD